VRSFRARRRRSARADTCLYRVVWTEVRKACLTSTSRRCCHAARTGWKKPLSGPISAESESIPRQSRESLSSPPGDAQPVELTYLITREIFGAVSTWRSTSAPRDSAKAWPIRCANRNCRRPARRPGFGRRNGERLVGVAVLRPHRRWRPPPRRRPRDRNAPLLGRRGDDDLAKRRARHPLERHLNLDPADQIPRYRGGTALGEPKVAPRVAGDGHR